MQHSFKYTHIHTEREREQEVESHIGREEKSRKMNWKSSEKHKQKPTNPEHQQKKRKETTHTHSENKINKYGAETDRKIHRAKRKANIVFSSAYTNISLRTFSIVFRFYYYYFYCSFFMRFSVVLLPVLPFLWWCFLLLYFSSSLCRSQVIVEHHSHICTRLFFFCRLLTHPSKTTRTSAQYTRVTFFSSSVFTSEKGSPQSECTRFILFRRQRLSFFSHNSNS